MLSRGPVYCLPALVRKAPTGKFTGCSIRRNSALPAAVRPRRVRPAGQFRCRECWTVEHLLSARRLEESIRLGGIMATRPILMYHAVNCGVDPYNIQVSPQRLRQQFSLIRHMGYRGVSVSRLLTPATSPERLVGLTFDDGYADFLSEAVPLLGEFGFTATVYMVAGLLGGRNEWDGPPLRPLLSMPDLATVLSAGHEIGSHGMTHASLPGLPARELAYEVTESRRVLEDVLGTAVTGFCYPYGLHDARAVALVSDQYEYACAIHRSRDQGAWTLPRFFVSEADHPLRLAAKLVLRTSRQRVQALTSK